MRRRSPRRRRRRLPRARAAAAQNLAAHVRTFGVALTFYVMRAAHTHTRRSRDVEYGDSPRSRGGPVCLVRIGRCGQNTGRSDHTQTTTHPRVRATRRPGGVADARARALLEACDASASARAPVDAHASVVAMAPSKVRVFYPSRLRAHARVRARAGHPRAVARSHAWAGSGARAR